jgi:uncharacterized protein
MSGDVFINEQPGGERAIVGVATTVTAFIGVTKLGRVNEPAHCFSFKEFELQFGGLDQRSDLSYAVHQFFANGGTDAIVIRIDDRCEPDAERILSGMHALDRRDPFNLLCLPGVSDPAVLGEASQLGASRRAFFIADLPESIVEPDDALALIANGALPRSDHAAVYYPWVHTADPLSPGRLRPVPPSGTAAGVYARVDSTEGVWRAPAGRGFPLVEVSETDPLTDDTLGNLNSHGINCIRTVRPSESVLWGARTLADGDSASSEWRYIPVRRTALYIEESLSRGLEWTVFEPNAQPLWTEIRQHVSAFLLTMFRQGAFQATKPEQGYFVKCGLDTMTQDDVNQGRINIVVGFAPLRPAEFVVISLHQLARQPDA